jgi:hypothetical protein
VLGLGIRVSVSLRLVGLGLLGLRAVVMLLVIALVTTMLIAATSAVATSAAIAIRLGLLAGLAEILYGLSTQALARAL